VQAAIYRRNDGPQKGDRAMPQDKSLFFYGPIYHRLFDPQLAETRQVAQDLIPGGSSVLDIGCGTGLFAFALREKKDCRVVGLDLSLRMLEFARTSNRFPDVTFVRGDATDLSAFADRSFDYATLLMLMHELTRPQQLRVLDEALRVAGRTVIIDSVSLLPKNAGGIGIRLVEATFGRDHNPNFKAFLAGAGIGGILRDSALPVRVEHRSVFWRNCREVVVASLRP
jgi:ubiquinone/menaquinone biosynthesis C-methylase UbiE